MRISTLLAVFQTLLLVLAAFGGPAVALAEQLDGPIRVTVRNRVLHAIDARLFGQFMERPSWGSEIGAEAAVVPGTHELQPDAKRLLQRMQVPVARFPGGTDVDYTDWLDMIDNVPGRGAERPITRGHTGSHVTNYFGYDEFLRLCQELAMEPIVVVNFRDGLLSKEGPEQAARHAAKLAAYCNARADAELPGDLALWPRLRAKNGHPEPYGVPYFQIGNETWAFSSKVSAEHYLAALKAYLDAIHAVDPTVRIIVDGQPADLAARVHEKLGDRIAYFAVHHYQPWRMREVRREGKVVDVAGLSEEEIWYAWVTVPRIDAAGQSVLNRRELEQAREKGYPAAMTEWNWNGWWGEALQRQAALNSPFAKGVGAAGILHAIIRQGDVVEMANQSMLIGDGWGIHAIYCDRRGRTPPYMIASGQVTMLYSHHHGNQRLAIDVENMPRYEQPYRMGGNGPAREVACVDLLATRDEATLYLHAVNRHFHRALTVEVDVAALGVTGERSGRVHTLEGRLTRTPSPGEDLAPGKIGTKTFAIPGRRFEVRLPRRSVNVVEVPLE